MKINKKHIEQITIGIFILFLFLPIIVQLSGFENNYLSNENRKQKDFPSTKNPIKFLKEFKAYYKDNYGLRSTLSNNYIQFKNEILKENPIPHKVIKGKNDFLFLGNSFDYVIDESLGFKLFTNLELEKIRIKLTKQRDWLKAQNIHYIFAIAPNKHNVYRENLPFKYPIKQTRKEQLIEYLENNSNLPIIDLGKDFDSVKQHFQIYRKKDTHWNEIGGYFASKTLFESMQSKIDFSFHPFNDYEIDTIQKIGDLSKSLNSNELDNNQILKPFFNRNIKTINDEKFYKNVKIQEERYINDLKSNKIVLFRDSFGSALRPFIKDTFKESVLIWSYNFDKELIAKEKPTFVIVQCVERNLDIFVE